MKTDYKPKIEWLRLSRIDKKTLKEKELIKLGEKTSSKKLITKKRCSSSIKLLSLK